MNHPQSLNIVRQVRQQMSPSDCAWQYLSNFRFYQRADVNPFTVLKDMQLLEDSISDVRIAVVTEMRADGASWGEVGEALGITRQGARQRYGGAGIR